MRLSRRTALLLGVPGLTLAAWPGRAAAADIGQQIKAAYLYKFVTYVEWPASAFDKPNAPLTIGILGANGVEAELANLAGARPANNRALEVKRLSPGGALAGLQMLFIGGDENPRLKTLLEGIQAQPVLSVTESAGALGAGSVINFVAVDDRIRFEVSLAQAERSGLKISSRLLAVAQKVETRKP
jgi:hypothetical protein